VQVSQEVGLALACPPISAPSPFYGMWMERERERERERECNFGGVVVFKIQFEPFGDL